MKHNSATYRMQMKATSPISHFGDEKAGNISLPRMLTLLIDGQRVQVPVVSANSVRGQWRRAAARRMLSECGISAVGTTLYHMLFSGGSLTKGAEDSAHRVELIRGLRNTVPMVGLLGASLETEIIPGSLRFGGMVWPVCSETFAMTGIASDVPAGQLLDTIYYTRRADTGEIILLDEGKGNQMIFESYAILAGTEFVLDVITNRSTDLEVGCLALAIDDWKKDARLGGQSARGHGAVSVSLSEEIPGANEYLRYLQEQGSAIRKALNVSDAAA